MNLKYMIELQGGLMEHIKKAKGLSVIPYEDTKTAFLVELGELANEVKYFKYWSKQKEPTEKTLEEYIDGLHFVLQIGILSGIKNTSLRPYKMSSISNQFMELFYIASKPNVLFVTDYYKLRDYYFGLGEMLGFTPAEIQEAYEKKNAVNHDRQNTGY